MAAALRPRGVRFLIDDFGSGLDSVATLRTLRPESVKIEPGLAESLMDNEEDRRAMKALTELAGVYGSMVCVKHIETMDINLLLRQDSIDCLQGYLFSLPLPAEEFEEFCFAKGKRSEKKA